MNTTPQTLDVTGLPPEAVVHLRTLATDLSWATNPPAGHDPMGDSAEDWVAQFQAFCDAQPWQQTAVDDSRESIYGDD